jgi:glycosyltransferase involved in cell wall biosynthesis
MSNQEPTVDIVVATNRRSPFLREALESVVAQDYPNWTLTVVDDGSPDPSWLEGLVHELVPTAHVIHQGNQGVAAARNAGIAATNSPLVTFLDDDDVWRSDRLRLLVAALGESPTAVASFSGVWYLRADGTSFGEGRPGNTIPRREMLNGNQPIPLFGATMMRRAVLELVGGFNPNYAITEDNDLLLRMLLRGEMVGVAEELMGYRRHANNVTNSPYRQHRGSTDMLRRLIEQCVDRGDYDNAELLKQNYGRYVERAQEALPGALIQQVRSGDYAGVRGDVVWGLQNDPFGFVVACSNAVGRRTGKVIRKTWDRLAGRSE